MAQLDAHVCRAKALAGVDHALHGGFVGVRVEPRAAVCDAPDGLDPRRFDEQQTRARIREHAEMHHMPVVHRAVVG
jgi:hypothetical protein